MAIRIRDSFHARGKARSAAELASVAAMLAWKLAHASLARMREAGFEIEPGRAYFDFMCEALAFLAHVADRIAFRELASNERLAFTQALAARVAQIVADNGELLLGARADDCERHFLALFNASGSDYAQFEYRIDGPDFGFLRLFAGRVRDVVPEKDRLWVADQVMAIEAPEAIEAMERTLRGLFHPDAPAARRTRQSLSGD